MNMCERIDRKISASRRPMIGELASWAGWLAAMIIITAIVGVIIRELATPDGQRIQEIMAELFRAYM
jgi:hypothetical protein